MSDLALFPASAGSHNKGYVFFVCVSTSITSGSIPFWAYINNYILLFLKLCFVVLVATLHRFEGEKQVTGKH